MALDKRLLDILCCPSTRQPVAPLSAEQLAALNRAVDRGMLRHEDGSNVTRHLAAGLLTRDQRIAYRIDEGIPVMLVDQSIATSQVEEFPT